MAEKKSTIERKLYAYCERNNLLVDPTSLHLAHTKGWYRHEGGNWRAKAVNKNTLDEVRLWYYIEGKKKAGRWRKE